MKNLNSLQDKLNNIIDLNNEWQLFKFNLKNLFQSGEVIGQRINGITGLFLCLLSLYIFIVIFNLIKFIGEIFIIPYADMCVIAMGLYLLFSIVHTYILGLRLQNYGVIKYVAFLFLLFVFAYYNVSNPIFDPLYYGYFLTHIPSNERQLGIGVPDYFDFITMVLIVSSFVPSFVGDNIYGNKPPDGLNIGKTVVNIGSLKLLKSSIKEEAFFEVAADAFSKFIKQPFYFKGRIKINEYVGVLIIINLCCFFIKLMVLQFLAPSLQKDIVIILNVLLVLSTLSLHVRRLHDSYHSAFWLLIILLPFVNIYVAFVLFFAPSWTIEDLQKFENKQ